MTTKTDITLPPLPPRDDVLPKLGDRAIGYSPVWNERSMLDYGAACARAAVAANRREYLDTLKLARAIVNGHRRDNPPEDSVEADRQGRMPSDEYLPNKLWEASQLHGDECIADALVRIRALLSRYGSEQPASFGQDETRMDADSSVKNEGDIGQPAAPVAQEPVAYMHTVIQDNGEPDQALSFSRDSFPLQGVAGFRSIGVVPLGIVAAQAQPKPASAADLPDPLSDFQEGQWWVRELDEWVNSGSRTDNQARAVAVVHNLLRSAARAAKEPVTELSVDWAQQFQAALENTLADAIRYGGGVISGAQYGKTKSALCAFIATILDVAKHANNRNAPVAQEPPQVTDAEIEKIVTGAGARWDGSVWKVEDADLHPMARALLYRYTTAPVAVQPVVTDEMVTRFLGWHLPQDFAPGAGISFKPLSDPLCWPIGTDLFRDPQARAMLEYVLTGVKK